MARESAYENEYPIRLALSAPGKKHTAGWPRNILAHRAKDRVLFVSHQKVRSLMMLKFLCVTLIILHCISNPIALTQFPAIMPGNLPLTEIAAENKRKALEIRRVIWYFWIWRGRLLRFSRQLFLGVYLFYELQPMALGRI